MTLGENTKEKLKKVLTFYFFYDIIIKLYCVLTYGNDLGEQE